MAAAIGMRGRQGRARGGVGPLPPRRTRQFARDVLSSWTFVGLLGAQ